MKMRKRFRRSDEKPGKLQVKEVSSAAQFENRHSPLPLL
jgi:hypothetical protein